ncbi:MAG TPA: hypothetical protein VFP22_03460 [Candidatus Limnocylindrales bacterium]|nr:hypothetical protein [Candidatus Limnocylindrales bacterium]
MGKGDGGATVELGVAGVTVGDCVAEDVGDDVGAVDRDAVGNGRLAVGEPESAGVGVAPGAPQAATIATIRSAAIG